MSDINPDTPYPGAESECTKTPRLQRLLDQFQTVKVCHYFLIDHILLNFCF
jgi:hypothetical protein